jgi:hypothetical protein
VWGTIIHLQPLSTDNLVTILIGVFGFGGTIFGLRLAYGQLVDGKQIAEETRQTSRGQFLLQLNDAFRGFDDVHERLMQPDHINPNWEPPASNWTRVVLYMGLFERCKILIDYDLLEPEIFERQYGYRLRRIVETPAIADRYLNERASSGWTDFRDLRDEMKYLYEERRGERAASPETPR